MKLLIATTLMVLTIGQANAISRYQTMRMSCAQVQATVNREGAVILRWQSRNTPGLPLYGRYVSDRRFCKLGEVTSFESVPTADNPSCTVKQCVQPDYDNMRFWLHDR
ncbi:hypothetical protein DY251_11180 [Mesorhizobium denitrificans]|uniref:Uncharacterized protein n=2 Tax=Phyllobacteriaceae TaxID=69277 RepID=A0A371XEI6_9HYPH|nr:hypothetical protein DY251_11180 [Mesorhizobium denitrificans]